MPELPDITLYLERLAPRVLGQPIDSITLPKPFVLRTVDPPLGSIEGRPVIGLQRLGKRIVLEFDDELFLVMHLMIAGRLRWRPRDEPPTVAAPPLSADPTREASRKRRSARSARTASPAIPARLVLATFRFPTGTLFFTEAGTSRRASLHVVRGRNTLAAFDRGGLEVLEASLADFAQRLAAENHTLKRSLTDPRLFSGIGNAYSDEIFHRARLSPLAHSAKLAGEDVKRLYDATRDVLEEWTARLRADAGDNFPETVTAFRDGMAVHGRFGQPCPVCGTSVQRIRYASNETNYCARCQTGGRLLADRALSRLLKQDWPRSIDDVE